jgi:uncharacterized protein
MDFSFIKDCSEWITMKTRILFLMVGLLLGAYVGGFLTSQNISTMYSYCVTEQPLSENTTIISAASIAMPAVDQDGKGVTTTLDVQMVPGSGKTLTNVDKLFFWTDTQNSIRTAKSVAQQLTEKNLDGYDFIYTINANATSIEGPSAGAALTVATIAAIENRHLNTSVMITGTINPDGSIGQVGGITEKAGAAKEIGAVLFLVPRDQSSETVYNPKEYCRKVGISQICSLQQIPQTIDVSEKAGIEVKEVRTVEDALQYLLI